VSYRNSGARIIPLRCERAQPHRLTFGPIQQDRDRWRALHHWDGDQKTLAIASHGAIETTVIVVSNTSSITNVAAIGKLELLHQIYQQAIIPESFSFDTRRC